MDISDPDFIKTCCSRCKYKLYSVLDSKGGVMCRFFWRDEECEYYKSSKEMMKPIQEVLDMVERVNRIKEGWGDVGPIQI
jgi:hypothetical protein